MDADPPVMKPNGHENSDGQDNSLTTPMPQVLLGEDPYDSGYFSNSASSKWSPNIDTRDGLNTLFTPIDTHINNDTEDFGDFADSDNEMDVEESCESWKAYDSRETSYVFYPVYVGEVLNQRYQVEHKISHGATSTVWMARDLQGDIDVALKVMCSGEWAEHEICIQDEVLQSVQETSHLVTYIETFVLHGDDRDHQVLVLPLVGQYVVPHVLKRAPMTTRMSAAHQLLKALEGLHKGQIIHRDLTDRNCMWGMTPLHNLIRSAKYKALRRPLKKAIPFTKLAKYGELVRPMKVPDRLRTEQFYLADFGLAMKVGDEPLYGFPPMQFCSPDRLHGQNPTFACDMWSYMIVFAELYLSHPPFPDLGEGGVVTGMVQFLGPLPAEWKGSYIIDGDHLDSWYDQDEKFDPKLALDERIKHFRPDVDPVERELVRSIMAQVFTFDPSKRLSATELLEDPLFKTLMEIYDC
ncbi:kinase domain-containing protein [Penicillium nucicola]|uniref:kinase domain-containing protein n=1 Tax=Penicillium nucicola TaxID=1850975 RepID=UPI0025452EAE|nr:kinase domain-containing protein [Penicillium nucicola]KAJ5771056.1 kinase domain-containing protein [Penicillium nucicola]